MPNYCYNKMTVDGPSDKLAEFYNKFRGHYAYYWVNENDYNAPKLDGKTIEEYNRDMEADELTKIPHICFNALYPVPEEVRKRGYDGHGRPGYISGASFDDPNRTLDGYNWQSEYWGTKWDIDPKEVSSSEESDGGMYEFNTAWSPPMPWLKHIAPMFPDLKFKLSYTEESNGFCGIYEVQNMTDKDDYADSSRMRPVDYYLTYARVLMDKGDYDFNEMFDGFEYTEPQTLRNLRTALSAKQTECKDEMEKRELALPPDVKRSEDEEYMLLFEAEKHCWLIIDVIDGAMQSAIDNCGNEDESEDSGAEQATVKQQFDTIMAQLTNAVDTLSILSGTPPNGR